MAIHTSRTRNLRPAAGALLTLYLTTTAWAQDPAAAIDSYLNQETSAGRFSGSVLAAKGGAIVLSKGYGLANAEHDVPNRPETKFRLGSITKQFAAVSILQLAEKGKLTLEDPVSKWMDGAPSAWERITIHHLLSHTSGIPGFTEFPDYRSTMMRKSRPEETLKRVTGKPLDFDPGTRWKYSNSGYTLLGFIVERASGMPWEDYVRKNIFDPAGMNDSDHDSDETVLKHRAAGYSGPPAGRRNAVFIDMTIPIGAGDLYSTVLDLYKWDRVLHTDKLLTAASRRKMWTPVLNGYAYGWQTADKPRRTVMHGGGINGFATSINRYPDDDAVVIVLANLENAPVGPIANNVTKLLFGEKIIRPEDRKEITLPASQLTAYAGEYEVTPTLTLSVTSDNGSLFVQLTGQPKLPVFAEAADRFFLRVADVQLTFRRDSAGAVNGVTLHQNGRETLARKKP